MWLPGTLVAVAEGFAASGDFSGWRQGGYAATREAPGHKPMLFFSLAVIVHNRWRLGQGKWYSNNRQGNLGGSF